LRARTKEKKKKRKRKNFNLCLWTERSTPRFTGEEGNKTIVYPVEEAKKKREIIIHCYQAIWERKKKNPTFKGGKKRRKAALLRWAEGGGERETGSFSESGAQGEEKRECRTFLALW